jgi:hypothetical protein
MNLPPMRQLALASLLAALVTTTASSTQVTSQSAQLSVNDAVSLYARGQFDTALAELDTRDLRVIAFTRTLDEWVRTGGSSAEPRRRLVVVAFAAEAVWKVTGTWRGGFELNSDPSKVIRVPNDPERIGLASTEGLGRVATWAALHLPKTGTPDALERLLWLATIGIAEDGHAWHWLQNDIVPPARKRLPDESRLRLADALARTNQSVGALRSVAYAARRIDALHIERIRTSEIPGAIRTFEPLLSDAALAGEVELRIGYLELRRNKWPAALARFDAARAKLSEPILLATTDYFAGWTYEQQSQPVDAIAAYRRAHAITPEMRNLSMRLSSLLFQRNEREEAYTILDRALNAPQVPMDLLVMLERADARFLPEWFASIRKALQ